VQIRETEIIAELHRKKFGEIKLLEWEKWWREKKKKEIIYEKWEK